MKKALLLTRTITQELTGYHANRLQVAPVVWLIVYLILLAAEGAR